MKFINDIYKENLKNCVVILGNFDGIHKGHLTLLDKAKKVAKEEGLSTAFFTFHPHPTHVLPVKEVQLISSDAEKQHIAEQEGMDYYIQFPFTFETMSMEAEDFIKDILIEHLDVKAIVVGQDYSFGKGRKGNIELLKSLESKYNYKLYALEKLMLDERVISSTWIREVITEADLEQAQKLMGREYFITGNVVKGAQLGRKIGFPTANIKPFEHKKLPKNGVYITKVDVKGQTYFGLTNVGTKPTIDVSFTQVLVETYIHDFDEDIYGQQINVKFCKYLRTEDIFDTLDDLIVQMKDDEKQLIEFFNLK